MKNQILTILKKPQLLRLATPIVVVILIASLFGFRFVQAKQAQIVKAPKSTLSKSVVSPSETPIATPSATVVPYTPQPTKPSLFELKISTIDYVYGRPNGHVLDFPIKLFTKDGNLIAEKKPDPVIQDGPVGYGGDATFYVPFGSYRAEMVGNNMRGSVEFTIDSFDDPKYQTIYLKANTITIHGKYFHDANRNTQYDEGEKVFANKKVQAIVDADGPLYTAFESSTDENGDFTLYPEIRGKYTLTGESIPGYNTTDQYWVTTQGGESFTKNLYVWQ